MSSKKKRGAVPFFVFLMAFCLASCGGQGKSEVKNPMQTAASGDASKNLSAARNPKEEIMAEASDSFFAGQKATLGKDFLNWFEKAYGSDALKSMVDNGVLDDPSVWKNSTGRTIKTLIWDYHTASGDSFYKSNKVKEIETKNSDKAEFLFSGDLTLAENTATTALMDKNPNSLSQCFDQKLMDTMRDADFFTINNEFCYAPENTGKKLPGKAYCFKADPKRAGLLTRIGADLVSLANNHVYDFGKDAFLSTLSTLDKNKVPYIGAGKNLNEAKKAYYVIANGRTVAVIAGTQIERSTNYTRAATADSPGVLKCLDPKEYVDAIETAKKNADEVIAICHWGTEGTNYYGADQTALAKDFIKAGADAVVGGHTHTLQAVEYQDKVPVFYSLGNFYFSSTMNMPRDYDTGLARISIGRNGQISEQFIPCHFSGGRTWQLKAGSSGYSQIISKMNSWSSTAVIEKNGVIKRK